MSKIDKMSILGIRSFDNVHLQSIQFFSPLTLIVGTNGSGKTTIIECLKFATTGETPPNTKIGGAFIHDPKLAGEREVLAQVKLSFRSTEGARMVCTRSLQLTVKKTARSVATLDSTILIRNNGEKKCVSSRVVEMNNLMPRYIGVSKAVLDNVIFCHQDESLWPLSSAADLKKKFDELFEALKYTKAIENIKILQKQQREKLVSYKKDEEKYKVDKRRGEKAQEQIKELDEKITNLRRSKDRLAAEISDAAARVNEAMKEAERVGLIVGQLEGKRIERRAKQESVESLREGLEEFTESDEELTSMLAQYEARMQSLESDKNKARQRYGEITEEIESTRTQISAQDRECGTYEAEKLSNDRKVELRQRLIQETARSHGVSGFSVELDHEKALEFMEHIHKLLRDQTTALERARREAQESLQVEQRQLTQISEKQSALKQAKETARQTINNYNRKLESLRQQLSKVQMDDISKQNLESQELTARSKLDAATTEIERAGYAKQIDDLNSEISKLDDRKGKLDEEMAEASRQATEIAESQILQDQLSQHRKNLSTMQGAHGKNISQLLGNDWRPSDVKVKYEELRAMRMADLRDAEKQLDSLNHALDSMQKQRSSARTDLKEKKESMQSAATKIRDTMEISPDDYAQELIDVTDDYTRLTSDAASSKRLVDYFDHCIKYAEENQCCRTCRRLFEGASSASQIKQFVEVLKKEKDKQELDAVAKDLRGVTEGYEIAKQLAPVHDEYERLKKEIPDLEAEARKFADKCEQSSTEVETQQQVVDDRREAVREAESIGRAVESIATSAAAIAESEDKLKSLQAKQKAIGLEPARSSSDISADQQKLSAETRALKGKLVKVTGDRDRATKQISVLQVEHSQVEKKLSTAVWQLKEREGLESQIIDLRSQMQEQNDSIKAKDQELKALEPERDQVQARYDDIAFRTATNDRDLQGKVNKLLNSKNELKLANDDIVAYIDRDGPKQLEHGKARLRELKQTLHDLQGQQNKVIGEVKQLEKEAADKGNVKRSISDNMRYRRDMKALARVEAEIEDLESRDAEADKARFDAEVERHHRMRQKLMSEDASIQGQLTSWDGVLAQSMANYDAEYQDASKNYKESHIRVETCKACIEDLGRYGGALDQAIMKYHSLKMEEINRIIDELWRRTYQGTDVDTIIIRSESENLRANKSYNYRVVMVKQETEMDMRGRCSAGQKVLACIIIRLALAECFGVNCGIIALDEPTTNLDRDNIRALAISLGEIIKVRKAQKNLQMIVITHDEEFLRLMNCSDHAENYYRVSRTDRQKSLVEKCPITDVV